MTAQDIYVGSSNILLYGFNSWTPYLQQDWEAEWTTPVTEIYYNRETGDLKAQGRVSLPGTIASQEWSFKQLSDSSVAIATTTRNPLTSVESFKVSENLEVGRNHLWVLKSENQVLKSLGSIINFGKPREDVRAVRYIDDMAYIVTFERTDPLYAINLSNREAPKVEDALEIPGFSMYLHPLSDQWLAGVGYDAEDRGDTSFYQGIQVSLFDISSQKTIQMDRKIFGTRGSYSDVTGNHKAFFFDSERSVFGVPMTLREGDSTDLFTLNPFGFSGMTLFSPSADGLIEKARITHSDFVQEYCGDPNNNWRGWQSSIDSLDINRAFIHEGRVVSISRFGLKAHHVDTYEVESITRFSDGARYCSEENMEPISDD